MPTDEKQTGRNVHTWFNKEQIQKLEQNANSFGLTPNEFVKKASLEYQIDAGATIAKTESSEPIEFDCFWGYKEPTVWERGRWSFKTATCEPKSRDNEISMIDLMKFACAKCPVFFKNKGMYRTAGARVASMQPIRSEEEEKGYLAKERQAELSSRSFKCEYCDFSTQEREQAVKHQEVSDKHWFRF